MYSPSPGVDSGIILEVGGRVEKRTRGNTQCKATLGQEWTSWDGTCNATVGSASRVSPLQSIFFHRDLWDLLQHPVKVDASRSEWVCTEPAQIVLGLRYRCAHGDS